MERDCRSDGDGDVAPSPTQCSGPCDGRKIRKNHTRSKRPQTSRSNKASLCTEEGEWGSKQATKHTTVTTTTPPPPTINRPHRSRVINTHNSLRRLIPVTPTPRPNTSWCPPSSHSSLSAFPVPYCQLVSGTLAGPHPQYA